MNQSKSIADHIDAAAAVIKRNALDRAGQDLDDDGARLLATLVIEAVGLDELMAALHNFTFPAYPDSFQSQDDGCTEAMVVDEHVQLARRLVGGLPTSAR